MNEQEKQRKSKYAELQRDITATPLPRHWALYRLLEQHLNGLTLKQICEMCVIDGKPQYTYNESAKCQSNHCALFYADRNYINLNQRFDKIILRDGDKWMFATEEQAREFYDECLDRAMFYHSIQSAVGRKIKLDGCGKLFSNDMQPIDENSKAKRFHETLITEDEKKEEKKVEERKVKYTNIFGVDVYE